MWARLLAGFGGSSSNSAISVARAAIAARRREDLSWLDACLHEGVDHNSDGVSNDNDDEMRRK